MATGNSVAATADHTEAKRVCPNCKKEPARKRSGLCKFCNKYLWRHGEHRPKYIIDRMYAKKWCKNCRQSKTSYLSRCNACAIWFKRYGNERPQYRWDMDMVCKICHKPLVSDRRPCHGRCANCHRFLKLRGEERPAERWGVTSFGWCECGQPAVNIVKGMALCGGCEALEKSVY